MALKFFRAIYTIKDNFSAKKEDIFESIFLYIDKQVGYIFLHFI